MFKTLASFTVNVGEKPYQIICDNDSPLEDVIIFLKFSLENCEKMLEERKTQAKQAVAQESEEQHIEEAVVDAQPAQE